MVSSSALIRALQRPSSQPSITYATNANFRMIVENRQFNVRQFSVFSEFSKNLKGEANSNPEFQQSMEELTKKIGIAKEDLQVRTKKTAQKLYKSVDDVWIEAETKSKKVSTSVKEKLSAAKEEVKETFGLGKNASSETETSQGFKESVGESNTLFGKFKSSFPSASPAVSSAFQKLKETKGSDLAKKGFDMVKDELNSNPSRTRRMQYAHASSGVKSTLTDIVVAPSKKSRLGEKWDAFKMKMEGIPLYKRMKGVSQPVVTNVVNKGQEIAEDVRECWETSDHPVVHKIQDLNESVFGESAAGLSFKEIRYRDPYFSLPDFVAEVEEMVRPVLTAYHKGDVGTLKKYCSSEMIARCKGERIAYESRGIFFVNKILHISDVDVRETKMMGSTPIIIIGFQTQQIYCVRDIEGTITDGGKDTIHTVCYEWAMQLMDMQELGEEALYPIWKLREMQQIDTQALI